MGHRTGVLTLAGMLALAVAVTVRSEDRAGPLPIEIRAPSAAPALTIDSTVDAAVPAPGELASPGEAITPRVQLVNVRAGVADSGRRVGFGQLVISFTRDSLPGRQELLAVVYLADTVRAERREAVMHAVALALLGEPNTPGSPFTPAAVPRLPRPTAQIDPALQRRSPWRTLAS